MKKSGVETKPHWATTNFGGQVWLFDLSFYVCVCVSDLKMMYMIFFFLVSQCKIAAYKKGSPQVW